MASKRDPGERRVPAQNSLHRSVVRLIVEDYEAGASLVELSKRYNVRRNTVRDSLRRAGFDTSARPKRAALISEQENEVRERFASGTTKRELAIMFDVSETTIKRVLRMTP